MLKFLLLFLTDYARNYTPTSRPSSSFSRYSVVPEIGRSVSNTPEPCDNHKRNSPSTHKDNNTSKYYSNVVNDLENMDLHKESKESDPQEEERTCRSRSPREKSDKSNLKKMKELQSKDSKGFDPVKSLFPPLKRKILMPKEPKGSEPGLLLAVKLPDGQRVQRNFRLSDTVSSVLKFAELSSKLDLRNCELICDVPRQVFQDFSVKLSDTNLQNRTVLHINRPDTDYD